MKQKMKSFNDVQRQLLRITKLNCDRIARTASNTIPSKPTEIALAYGKNISAHFGCAFGKMSPEEHDVKVPKSIYAK